MNDNDEDHQSELIGGHRFYVGSDKEAAKARVTALQLLWRDNVIANGTPEWSNLGISLARDVAAGANEVLWPPNGEEDTPEDYASAVKGIRQMFPSLRIVPSDHELYAAGTEADVEVHPWEPAKPKRKRRVRANSVTVGNCIDLIDSLPDSSINLALTSPPYAEQRNGKYPGVKESNYPDWTVAWMSRLWPKLADNGSVLIVIDPHVRNGRESEYVLHTQLALVEAGWTRARPNIWIKPDSFPLGRNDWPRHSYESILWFTKSPKPFCDPKADGSQPVRKVQDFRNKKWMSGGSVRRATASRVQDVHTVAISSNAHGVGHTAMFPQPLAERLIKTYCPENGTVLDCFCGSGTTLIAAKSLGRRYYGFDLMQEYCDIARKRLRSVKRDRGAA